MARILQLIIVKQKTMIKMKVSYKKITMLAAVLTIGVMGYAQNFNVETAKMILVDHTVDDTEKDLTKCLDLLTAASNNPKTSNSPKMWFYKGLLYLKISSVNSELTKATPDAIDISLESFQNAIKTDVKNKYTDEAKGHLLNVAIGLYNKAYNAYQAKDFAVANAYFKKTLPLMAYDVEGLLKRNGNLTAEVIEQMIAFTAIEMGDTEGAKKSLKSLISKGSSDPALFSNLALLHLKEGDTTTALQVIADGKELNEADKTLINQELDIYLKQGRSEELIDKLNLAIEDDPGNTIYYFARAISYEGLGDLEKAGADYDKILEIDPEYFDAAYNKGVMYLTKIGDLVDEMNEKNIYKPSVIAVYEKQINELYAGAIVQFENVFENNGDMPDADRLELARTMKKIYAQLGQMDKYNEIKAYISDNE
jgi:tetratricopeptide (TPR) repeat protein